MNSALLQAFGWSRLDNGNWICANGAHTTDVWMQVKLQTIREQMAQRAAVVLEDDPCAWEVAGEC